MNLLFEHRHVYVVKRPLDMVESRVRYIVTRRWDDYSMDLTGRLKKNGYFCLKNKWGYSRLKWLVNRQSSITGRMSVHPSGSCIEITTHANKVLIIAFYTLLVLAAVELTGLEQLIPVHLFIKAGLLLGGNLVVLIFILFRSKTLVKNFEQQMLIGDFPEIKEVVMPRLIPGERSR